MYAHKDLSQVKSSNRKRLINPTALVTYSYIHVLIVIFTSEFSGSTPGSTDGTGSKTGSRSPWSSFLMNDDLLFSPTKFGFWLGFTKTCFFEEDRASFCFSSCRYFDFSRSSPSPFVCKKLSILMKARHDELIHESITLSLVCWFDSKSLNYTF